MSGSPKRRPRIMPNMSRIVAPRHAISLPATLFGMLHFTLIYADDGKGIPHEDCERVFEPFFTTRRRTGNTGLGLHIVFNLVTGVLGGDVACDSDAQRGTRFILKLPYKATTQPEITA
ncbi:hypothetical protein WCLP8_5320004 [uncultured Gammaproteobacteria bacterium]